MCKFLKLTCTEIRALLLYHTILHLNDKKFIKSQVCNMMGNYLQSIFIYKRYSFSRMLKTKY